MAQSILTGQQSRFLLFVSNHPSLSKSFYFTGGTCLAEYYLHHRFSEDLDFFSEEEFDPSSITALFTYAKQKIGYSMLEFQQSFNRNLYFFTLKKKDTLKVEYTFFPFPRIDTTEKRSGLQIDSLKDICVNKIFTVYQNPRGRDFYDLFVILQTTEWKISDLVKLAGNKFDTPIDLLQLGGNFMKVTQLKDDPLVSEQTYPYKAVEDFFLSLALSFKKEVIS